MLEELHRDGVRVFLLKAYAANPDALEAVAALGAAAVVEDWLASRARPEAVLLSIETDLHETLERALAAAADLTAAPGPASGTPDPGRGVLIEGPVRLVRGGALPGKALPVGDGARR